MRTAATQKKINELCRLVAQIDDNEDLRFLRLTILRAVARNVKSKPPLHLVQLDNAGGTTFPKIGASTNQLPTLTAVA